MDTCLAEAVSSEAFGQVLRWGGRDQFWFSALAPEGTVRGQQGDWWVAEEEDGVGVPWEPIPVWSTKWGEHMWAGAWD